MERVDICRVMLDNLHMEATHARAAARKLETLCRASPLWPDEHYRRSEDLVAATEKMSAITMPFVEKKQPASLDSLLIRTSPNLRPHAKRGVRAGAPLSSKGKRIGN